MSLPHAEVLFLSELDMIPNPIGRYVRTTGIIDSYDVASATCQISHKSVRYIVDAEMIRTELAIGSLYQFFGEIQPVGSKVLL